MFSKKAEIRGIYRIIDANANRLKEGLRVCEEVSRFVLEDKKLTRRLKSIRHDTEGLLDLLAGRKLRLDARDSRSDTGRAIHAGRELQRSSVTDVFTANIQRATESMRVLEEFSKMINKACALGFKELRYRAYEIEKCAGHAMRADHP